MNGTRVILAAHRGDRKNFPENTIPAFEAAISAGVDMIETDIHQTADGELVLIHDRTALRTAGVDRIINEMTLAEVKELDAGICFGEEFRGFRIPTVREFLERIRDTDILVNWELKDYPNEAGEHIAYSSADKLIAFIEEYGMEHRSMVNSFSNRVLEYICREHGHRLPIHGQGIYHCLRHKELPEIDDRELFDWCCLYPNEKTGNPVDFKENFDYCLANGVIPCVCIPDAEETYQKALDYGCKMFTSNDIYAADSILRKLGVRK